MIEEADFQKIGNAAIDLCVFVDKLRLGEKHREEADKLTHNVLNLIKQTGKIEDKEPLTEGNEMSKKLKIQFWKAEKALAMQILEQEVLPENKCKGFVKTEYSPTLGSKEIWLRGREVIYDSCIDSVYFKTNADRDAYLEKIVNAITDELFTGEGELKVGEMCEVRDDEDESWIKRRLIAILPEEYDKRFIAEWEDYPTKHCPWEYARPITKRIEPIIKECGNVVTYTWEE